MKKEMVEEKGLSEEVADVIGEYVKLNGTLELLDKLTSDPRLMAVKEAAVGLEDMKLLLQYCKLFGVLDRVRGWSVASVCTCSFSQYCKLFGVLDRVRGWRVASVCTCSFSQYCKLFGVLSFYFNFSLCSPAGQF